MFADVLYWNTVHPGFYAAGGAGGAGIFRADTNWSSLPIGAKFTTAAVASSAAQCKDGAWQDLVRDDFTAFRNQGDCVSYTTPQD